jgi:uncharacterized protein with HEPN domain
MSKRNNFLLLTDILEAIDNIEEYLQNMTEEEFYNRVVVSRSTGE